MDFNLKMAGLMAILGVIFNFFYVAFFVMCGTMGYLFHVWGGVGVGLELFFSCDKYLY